MASFLEVLRGRGVAAHFRDTRGAGGAGMAVVDGRARVV
jgi:hypothetical protein